MTSGWKSISLSARGLERWASSLSASCSVSSLISGNGFASSLLAPRVSTSPSHPPSVRGFFSMSSFELSSPLKTSTTSAPGHGFKFSHLGSIQVRYTKREMRRMYKNLIKYPEHQQPKRFIEPGTHPSWEQRFKVNLVNGVPTVLNRRPGFSHNLYSVSNNQHRWARKWVPTPDWYVTKMKKLGLRISTAYKQKTERPRPYVPS